MAEPTDHDGSAVLLGRREAARRLLAWTGLDRPVRASTAETVARLRVVQMDPMQVVAPAHLWTLSLRRGPTPLWHLDAALAAGDLLEAYCGVRSLVHVRDAAALVAGWRRWRARGLLARYGVEDAGREVLSHAETGTAFLSRALGGAERVRGFWDAEDARQTKATSLAVDLLWSEGRLAVVGRRQGQKLYRLMEAHLPAVARLIENLPAEEADLAALRHHLAAAGLTDGRRLGWGELSDPTRWRREALASGWMVPVRLDGVPAYRGYAVPEWLALPPAAPRRTYFMAPVDNVVNDRPRLEALFGFRYRWDAYTPATRRRGGVYNMPVLHGSVFWGEADAQFRGQALQVVPRPLDPGTDVPAWWEKAVRDADALCRAIRQSDQGASSGGTVTRG